MTQAIKSEVEIRSFLEGQISKFKEDPYNAFEERGYYSSGRKNSEEWQAAEIKWLKLVELYLKKSFSDDSISQEFMEYPIPLVMRSGYVSEDEEIKETKLKIRRRIEVLESIIERLPLLTEPENEKRKSSATSFTSTVSSGESKKVFVVHGHDDLLKNEVARFLEKLGFEAIILHEQANSSRTIIEKIEANTDVDYGVVLYTPCDIGAKHSEKSSLNGRARQNVVFEHGFLIGKLGRKRVAALVKGKVELPNDISGVVYIPASADEWKIDIAKDMKEAGLDVNFNLIF